VPFGRSHQRGPPPSTFVRSTTYDTGYVSFARKSTRGSSSVTSTVWSSRARTPRTSCAFPSCRSVNPAMSPRYVRATGDLFAGSAARSMLYITSAARTSRPSWNRALRRSVKVYVRPSCDTWCRSARSGTTSSFSFSPISPLNTCTTYSASTALLAWIGSSVS
jgi:hypothetical protein